MHELHLLHLEARRVREAPPLHAYEVSLRARELARLHVRVSAGPPVPRRRPRLAVVRAQPAQAEPARGRYRAAGAPPPCGGAPPGSSSQH
jgi:hypothetical protein